MSARRQGGDAPGWSWRSPAASAVLEVAVPVPGGASVTVDALDPAVVLGVEAPTAGALGGLADVLGRAWVRGVLGALGPGGASRDAALAPGPLPEGWQRVATVVAVRRWSPAPLDESDLGLDEALAWAAAGVTGWAAAVASVHSHRALELVRRLHSGVLPPSAHAALEAAAALVAAALPEDDEVRLALAEAEAQMAGGTTIDDAELAAAMDVWAATVGVGPDVLASLVGAGAGRPSYAMGGEDGGDEVDPSGGAPVVLVDPRTVPARLLARTSSGLAAVTAERRDAAWAVSALLGPGTDAGTAEARHLVAFAADASTGELLGHAPALPDGPDRVVATLDLVGDAVGDAAGEGRLVLGLCQADALGRVRTTPAGRAAAGAEDRLIGAWSAARLVVAGHGTAEALLPALAAADDAVLDGEDPDAHEAALARVHDRLRLGAAAVSGVGGPGPLAPLLAEVLLGAAQ